MNKSRGKRSGQGKSRLPRASKGTSAPLPLEALTAISSVDGRYRTATEVLAPYSSEFARIRMRVLLECEYLIALSRVPKLGVRRLKPREEQLIRSVARIDAKDANIIKKIEREGFEGIPATNHDVKAIEYFIKWKLHSTSLEDVLEWVHFGLTSEDVDNFGDTLLMRDALELVLLPSILDLRLEIERLSKQYAGTPMLARTHGQPASPTTFGKEMRVFAQRLERQYASLSALRLLVKFGGATGNMNAHVVAAPHVDWRAIAQKFVTNVSSQGGHTIRLEKASATTQIVPYDSYAEVFDAMRRINTILIDFSQDMWRYISDGWVAQKPKAGETGSSTMPHKVNPIDFENAEGNFGVANALLEHFSRKLPVSRLQRDLSDSTVKRAFGTAFAHSLIGYKALMRGLGKVGVNKRAMLESLQAHPEVIAEALQTVLRAEGVAVPYEKLKELTRGKQVTLKDFARFIDSLDIAADVKKRLKALRPETYIGIAERLARD